MWIISKFFKKDKEDNTWTNILIKIVQTMNKTMTRSIEAPKIWITTECLRHSLYSI